MCVSNVITASPHPTYIPTRRPSDLLRAGGPAQDSGPRSCVAYFAPDSSWSRRFPDWTSGVPSRLRSTSCQEGQEKRSGRSEEHTSELQSSGHLVCCILLAINITDIR